MLNLSNSLKNNIKTPELLTINDLFSLLLYASQKHNLENSNFDGHQYWLKFKQIFAEKSKPNNASTWTASYWKPMDEKLFNEIIKLSEFTNNNMIKQHHFLIQLLRIQLCNRPTLQKICQIALNVGQYLGTKEHNKKLNAYKNNITITNIKATDYISDNDARKKLTDFIGKEEIISLISSIIHK